MCAYFFFHNFFRYVVDDSDVKERSPISCWICDLKKAKRKQKESDLNQLTMSHKIQFSKSELENFVSAFQCAKSVPIQVKKDTRWLNYLLNIWKGLKSFIIFML